MWSAGMSTQLHFFTDSTLCIGCKACEVACKEWNRLGEDGFELERKFLRQHRGRRAFHMASREVCREHAGDRARRQCRRSLPVGVLL